MVEALPTQDFVRAGKVICDSFNTIVFQRYIAYDKTPEEELERLTTRVQKYAEVGSQVVEAGDFSAIALWVPPNVELAPGSDQLNHRFEEAISKGKIAHKRHFENKPHWNLSFLARDPNRDTKGVVSAVVRPFLERALKEDVPASLMAVSDHAKNVYEHFGFKVLETIPLGVGEVDEDGKDDKEGKGLKSYLMAFNYK